MQKFHLITEKHCKNIRLIFLSKNTAPFSTCISKKPREKKCEKLHLKSIFRVSYLSDSTLVPLNSYSSLSYISGGEMPDRAPLTYINLRNTGKCYY